MARITFLFLGLFSVCIAFAQADEWQRALVAPHALPTDSLGAARTAYSGFVALSTSAEIGSNALRNDLFTGILRGEFLSRELRQASSDNITDVARAGLLIDHQLRVVFRDSLFGKPHLLSAIQIGHTNAVGVAFEQELYDLTFFGNKPRIVKIHNRLVEAMHAIAHLATAELDGMAVAELPSHFAVGEVLHDVEQRPG